MMIVLLSVTLLLGISQTVLYAWSTPPGTVFPLVHNFIEDYYQYLDIMRQGYDGWWTSTSRLTPEVFPRMVVSVFLLFLGHAARVLHISLPVAYTLARVTGGIALMALVYQLAKRTFPSSWSKQIIAFCFVLFGTYFWGWGSGGPTVAVLTHAWTELDPIFRWSFVPHHLWSKVGMVAAFLILLRPRVSPKDLILLAMTVFITGMTNPVVYATMVPVVGLWFMVEWIRDTTFRKNIWHYAPWIVVAAVSGAITLYHRYLQAHVFPWTSYAVWKQTFAYEINPLDYALSLGPTLVLFLFAIPAIRRLGRVGSLYLAWAAGGWIMLYIIGPFTPITPERFLGGYQFIPLGLGAAVFVFSHKRLNLLWLGVVVLLLGYFAVGLWASVAEHAGYVAANRNNSQVYVPNDLMAAFGYLSSHGKPEEVVMAPYEISTMIPGLTGKRVMAGHAMFTKDVEAKKALINDFFAGKNPVLPKDTAWILVPSSFTVPQKITFVNRYSNKSYTIYSQKAL